MNHSRDVSGDEFLGFPSGEIQVSIFPIAIQVWKVNLWLVEVDTSC